jgi:hypothetical protein
MVDGIIVGGILYEVWWLIRGNQGDEQEFQQGQNEAYYPNNAGGTGQYQEGGWQWPPQ